MPESRLFKTVTVRNPRNVVIQIPGAVVAMWNIKEGDNLEVNFDGKNESVTIKPRVRRGSNSTSQS